MSNPPPAAHAPCRVWIGTSGYSFRGWSGSGLFYPEGIQPRQMLSYYATHFPTVEINYTYYGMPTARTSADMAARTPEHFPFFVKAHKTLTHDRDLSTASRFLEGIEPLRQANKLKGVLCQFPQSFKNTQESRSYLSRMSDRFRSTPLAVEFRDVSWADNAVYNYLEKTGLTFVAVDEPGMPTLFPSRTPIATNDIGYIRFHSRNAENWYRSGAERYDYFYDDDELSQWLPVLEKMASRASDIFVYFNNCHANQAVENAQAMQNLVLNTPGLTAVRVSDSPLFPMRDGNVTRDFWQP
jgi:uncharacterized protein YecE (DUF72 family)